MKEVTAYQAKDGTIHKTKIGAYMADNKTSLIEAMEQAFKNNKIDERGFGMPQNYKVTLEDIAKFLLENASLVRNSLSNAFPAD